MGAIALIIGVALSATVIVLLVSYRSHMKEIYSRIRKIYSYISILHDQLIEIQKQINALTLLLQEHTDQPHKYEEELKAIFDKRVAEQDRKNEHYAESIGNALDGVAAKIRSGLKPQPTDQKPPEGGS